MGRRHRVTGKRIFRYGLCREMYNWVRSSWDVDYVKEQIMAQRAASLYIPVAPTPQRGRLYPTYDQ